MSTIHPEQTIENSLTSPLDRNPDRSYKPTQGHPNLSDDEVVNAMTALNNRDFVKKFLSVERRYADPVDALQRIGLISFTPAKGATPDSQGVYGFAKLRGNYPTDNEANERAEFLIRNVDSYHQIYHAYVGRPFPLTESSKYSADTSEIDLRKSMTDSVSLSVKNKKNDERQQIKEIEDREEKLKEDCKKEEEDPYEFYTTLRVKKAQITWTYLETKKKLDEMKDIIIKTRDQLTDMEKQDELYAKTYFKKYCDARTESGLSNSTNEDTFMKFLVEDHDLGF
jgi:hypothetical protein